MRLTPRLVVLSLAACVGLVLLTAWIFELKLERAVALAPVIVVAVGAAAGILVLWARVLVEHVRRARNPRRVLVIAAGAVALIAVLAVLGVELPRE